MKAGAIVDYIFGIASNPEWAKENIYEFGDGDAEVSAVGVAWRIDSTILRSFAERGIQLGITHERIVYDTPDWYRWGAPCRSDELVANQRITQLVRQNGITIHRFHSNIDLAGWGMPHALIEELGWAGHEVDWSRGVPVVTLPVTSLRQLIAEVKERLKLPFARYDGELDRQVSRVALAWGGMSRGWAAASCAAPLGFDVLIGGDITDVVVRFAREQGWVVIDALHHATEMEAMRRLAQRLEQQFAELSVHYYENDMPWSVA